MPRSQLHATNAMLLVYLPSVGMRFATGNAMSRGRMIRAQCVRYGTMGSTLCKLWLPVIWKYGQKLGEIVQLIKSIPEGDKVLLFVQFPNVLEELNGSLKKEGINYSDLNSGDSSKKLSAFQNNITYTDRRSMKGKSTQGPDKVLFLNIGDASASGR
jgi:hypothetical protein